MIDLSKYCRIEKDYVFFLKGPLSQWWKSPFEENGISYLNCEQYMMYQKAKLFKDDGIAEKILNAKTPVEHKYLGRLVGNFNEKVWGDFKFKIVCAGNLLKFTQNEELKEVLKNTGERILVEANEEDRIWGIGMCADDENIFKTELWGQNLLGKALMKVRNNIKS